MAQRIVIDVKGNIERALKEFKRKHQKIGIVEELRDRTEYVKPSVKRRTEIKDAIYRQKKKTESEKDK
jgi:small subunit ribosomal protein S21